MTKPVPSRLSNCYTPIAPPSSKTAKALLSTRSDGSQTSSSFPAVEEESSTSPTKIPRENVSLSRGPCALRRLVVETSVTSKAAGSALVELGHTKVLCRCWGPKTTAVEGMMDASSFDMDQGTLSLHVQYAPSVGLPREAQPSNQVNTLDARSSFTSNLSWHEIDLQTRLQSALVPAIPLEPYKKCRLPLDFVVLQDDGSVLSACIAAASLALADACVELYDVVTACTVAVMMDKNDDQNTAKLWADPTADELTHASAVITLAMMPNWKEVTLWNQSGRPLSAEVANQAAELCRDGCRTMHRFVRQALLDSQGNNS